MIIIILVGGQVRAIFYHKLHYQTDNAVKQFCSIAYVGLLQVDSRLKHALPPRACKSFYALICCSGCNTFNEYLRLYSIILCGPAMTSATHDDDESAAKQSINERRSTTDNRIAGAPVYQQPRALASWPCPMREQSSVDHRAGRAHSRSRRSRVSSI